MHWHLTRVLQGQELRTNYCSKKLTEWIAILENVVLDSRLMLYVQSYCCIVVHSEVTKYSLKI